MAVCGVREPTEQVVALMVPVPVADAGVCLVDDHEARAVVEKVRAALTKRYANEPFVTILQEGTPSTHQVRGTNQCVMAVHKGRLPNELIIVSVIDNLVKGASGQALQNANLMFGLPETTNLELTAIFP